MAKLVYRCRVCKKNFPRENLLGRLPRACPEHRHLVKGVSDRKRGDPVPRLPCCVEAGRQCAQHRQWKQFKRTWIRQVRKPADDPISLALMDLFYSDVGDGSDGVPIHQRKSGYSIVTLGE